MCCITHLADPSCIQAASHSKRGWEQFTAAVLKVVISRLAPTSSQEKGHGANGVVFMAWGAHAAKMIVGVDEVCFVLLIDILQPVLPLLFSIVQPLSLSLLLFKQARRKRRDNSSPSQSVGTPELEGSDTDGAKHCRKNI